MNLLIRTGRRIAVAIAAGGAILVPVGALAMPGSTAGTAVPAVAPACETPGLVVWLDTNGNGALGSVYYNLEFTNLSGHACTLNGFPFIRAVSLQGTVLGRRAAFDTSATPHSVRIGRGKTVKALLQIVDVGVFTPSACHPVTAAGLRVYPPNQTRPKDIPFPFGACSRRGPVFMRVGPVKK